MQQTLATGVALPSGLRVRPLAGSAPELVAARALLTAALPHDRIDVVLDEKLLGGNGRRPGQTLGAFTPSGELLGVVAQAGRFIKLLAVLPAAQRRGVGTALLQAARAFGPPTDSGARPRLRVGDHAGNYLSPGADERYAAARAFFTARGFAEVGRNLNLRTALAQNPLVTPERAESLERRAAQAGYRLLRAGASEAPVLLELVEREFSWWWAYEVRRALGPTLPLSGPATFGDAAAHTPELPEGPGVHVALDAAGAPVAFAAHDGNNRGLGWFGPMGTLSAHRGHGLGEALLLRCLLDVRERAEGGVIAWVGPEAFYARAAGTVPDRRFIVFEEAAS
jgi:GNAT superfamily N-acetyltransferase